jgi:hypothetical protein
LDSNSTNGLGDADGGDWLLSANLSHFLQELLLQRSFRSPLALEKNFTREIQVMDCSCGERAAAAVDLKTF